MGSLGFFQPGTRTTVQALWSGATFTVTLSAEATPAKSSAATTRVLQIGAGILDFMAARAIANSFGRPVSAQSAFGQQPDRLRSCDCAGSRECFRCMEYPEE